MPSETPKPDKPRKPSVRSSEANKKNPRGGLYRLGKEALEPATAAAVVEPQVWHRGSRESDAHWELFRTFRDMAYPDGLHGPFHRRDLTKLAKSLGVNRTYVSQVSTAQHWFPRAVAYDQWVDRLKCEATVDEAVEVSKRLERSHVRMAEILELEIAKAHERALDPEAPAMTPRELSAFFETVTKYHRLFTGQSTENVSIRGDIDLEGLPLERLLQLKEIVDEANANTDKDLDKDA